MDPSRDTETEARPVKNDEDGKARVDKFNKEVENIQKFNDNFIPVGSPPRSGALLSIAPTCSDRMIG